MTLKYLNKEHTLASFDGGSFLLTPDKWDSIGNRVTREAVKTWLAAGNTPEAYTEPLQPIPTVVTMRQARLALLQTGKLAQVDVAIDAMESPAKEAARIEWEYSQEVHRSKPFVQQLGVALGLTEADLDDLFSLAVTL